MTAYERAAETNADRAGAYMCAKAGFNPWGMVWNFRQYRQAMGVSSSGGADHPSDVKREADLVALFQSDKATFGKFRDNAARARPLAPPQMGQRNIRRTHNIRRLSSIRSTLSSSRNILSSSIRHIRHHRRLPVILAASPRRPIAEALYPYPENLVIATKAGLVLPGPGRWELDCHPQHLRAAVEGSLKRLRLERIDLFATAYGRSDASIFRANRCARRASA